MLIPENCGDKFWDISHVVDQARALARLALVDAHSNGVDSTFGFKAMFKEDEAQKAVVTMLDHIYYLIGKRNLKPRLDRLTPPRLACVTEGSAWLYGFLDLGYDPWHRCLVGGPHSTPVQAFYAENTVYTFLCPAFFVQPPVSTRNHCPLVTNNQFSGDSGVFYGKYQIYILLYQLIRFYLGHNALTSHTDPQEQLDWNACLCLNMLDSVLNPTNLQVYIACKRTLN